MNWNEHPEAKTPDAGVSVWGSGFLPSVYQGVQCRTDGIPTILP
ncbi:MAG: hypothetical protein ACREIA_14910 [Opitutaceae bacterium]